MTRDEYLAEEDVAGFVSWLVHVIKGDLPIIHSFTIRDRRRPQSCIEGDKFRVQNLEEAFLHYFWDRKDFGQNAQVLALVQAAVNDSVENKTLCSTKHAIHEVLKWGAGGVGTKLYTANWDWALQQGDDLVKHMSSGRLSMDSDDLADSKNFSQAKGPRMNAGFTKYYALACQNSIIYDGRVGAALGLLVSKYCIEKKQSTVPEELAFRWGAQSGKNALNRNPSTGYLIFKKLPVEGKIWAEWNKKANWILQTAIEKADANWVNYKADGLRRLEAALFMLGYSMDTI